MSRTARDVGGLTAFTAGGKTFDAAQLDACNTKAGVAAQAIAKN